MNVILTILASMVIVSMKMVVTDVNATRVISQSEQAKLVQVLICLFLIVVNKNMYKGILLFYV